MNGAATLLVLLALFPRVVEPQGTGAREANVVAGRDAYRLTAQIPSAIRKGDVVTLVLHVRKDGLPIDHLTCCLSVLPLFPSAEDMATAAVSGGIDLGTGSGSSGRGGCPDSIAGTMVGPGTYEFTLEPDTAGRVNLIFRVGADMLTVPVDVAGAPPNPAILGAFAILVAAIMGPAALLRRRLRREKAGS